MNYQQALTWLHSLGRMAAKPGLDRMQVLLAALGNPQRRLRFIHIAGTNGKGSTLALLSSILTCAGYKTGANYSPYILDFRERFVVDGEMIPPDTLAEILTKIKKAAEALGQEPIEFEAVVAASLLYFEAQGCDIVCFETGIGGRLDATNVIENTLVACITKIGFDHTAILGNTLVEITREKCGIIKNKCPVVCYPEQEKEVIEEILLNTSKNESPLTIPSMQDFYFYRSRPFENHINYGGYEVKLPFLGRHQAYNAAVAIETALELWRMGFSISDEAICGGLESARLPARVEVLSQSPLVILDGAHNANSAKALADTLRQEKTGNLVAITGVLKDKDPHAILTPLLPLLHSVLTVTPPSPRAMEAQQLASQLQDINKPCAACASLDEAMDTAKNRGTGGILIFGSFYLASQAKAYWEKTLKRGGGLCPE